MLARQGLRSAVPRAVDRIMRAVVPALFCDPKIVGSKGLPFVNYKDLGIPVQRKLESAVSVRTHPVNLNVETLTVLHGSPSWQGLRQFCLVHAGFARKRLAQYQRHRCRLVDPRRDESRAKQKSQVARRREALRAERQRAKRLRQADVAVDPAYITDDASAL
jgi:hypothetical protein